jgi:hypothetical protein
LGLPAAHSDEGDAFNIPLFAWQTVVIFGSSSLVCIGCEYHKLRRAFVCYLYSA